MLKRLTTLLLIFTLPCGANDAFTDVRRAQRRVEAHTVKSAVGQFDESTRVEDQPTNGDERQYADLRGSFGKALAHMPNGFINPDAFDSLVFALDTASNTAFGNIVLGFGRPLVNPQASLAFSLPAIDGWIHSMPAAPAFDSTQTAGEMVELYWTALVRDVPFNEFDTNATAAMAIADLNSLTDFRGPKIGGMVTPQTFLRGSGPGELVGPYMSQFFLKNTPYGATVIPNVWTVPLADTANDFMTDFTDWFTVDNGGDTGEAIMLDPTQQILRTPRDLGEYVHQDTPIQSALNALLQLNALGTAALDPANPYFNNPTQEGFVTFGIADFQAILANAIQEGLKTAWYQKWQVHRRLRPEEYGFYVQEQTINGQPLGINAQLTGSPALPLIFGIFGSNFLPQAYPEGSPAHPSYPAGHAVFIGAAMTILKAIFNDNFEIPNPVQPNAANTGTEPFVGMLTIGGELNKLASNTALGRDHAGVHYRSDGQEGVLLGEKIAIDVLNNTSFLFNENFNGYSLTKLNGTTVVVGKKRAP